MRICSSVKESEVERAKKLLKTNLLLQLDGEPCFYTLIELVQGLIDRVIGIQFARLLCGMVWYGMVWYGMVWYGMVWYGVSWYSVWLRCLGFYSMAWYGVVWRGMAWYGVV